MGYRRRPIKESLALVHAQARIEAKLSQDYMAQELEVSKKTVISWEKGISSPPIDRSFEWFEICGVNPLSQYLKVIWPELADVSTISDEDVDASFQKLFQLLPSTTKRALLFLFFGNHGSSPDALVQLLLAYLHTPLTSRATQAITSANMYRLEKELGKDSCPDDIQPDIDLLERAINDARVKILKESAAKHNH